LTVVTQFGNGQAGAGMGRQLSIALTGRFGSIVLKNSMSDSRFCSR